MTIERSYPSSNRNQDPSWDGGVAWRTREQMRQPRQPETTTTTPNVTPEPTGTPLNSTEAARSTPPLTGENPHHEAFVQTASHSSVGAEAVRSATPWINTLGGKIAATVAIGASAVGIGGVATGNIPNPFGSNDKVAAAPVVPGIDAEQSSLAEYQALVDFRDKIDFISPELRSQLPASAEAIHAYLIDIGWGDYNYFTNPADISLPPEQQRPKDIAPVSESNTAQEIRDQIAAKQMAVQTYPDTIAAQKFIPAITTMPRAVTGLQNAINEKATRAYPTLDIMNAIDESVFLDVNMSEETLNSLPWKLRTIISELKASGDGIGLKVSNNTLLVGPKEERYNSDGSAIIYQCVDVLTQGNESENQEWSTFHATRLGQDDYITGPLGQLDRSTTPQ